MWSTLGADAEHTDTLHEDCEYHGGHSEKSKAGNARRRASDFNRVDSKLSKIGLREALVWDISGRSAGSNAAGGALVIGIRDIRRSSGGA